MFVYTRTRQTSRHTDRPFNAGQRRRCGDAVLGKRGLVVNHYGCEHAAKAARGAVYLEFGRHGAALDQADFVDREPWQNSARAPGAWVR